MAEKPELLPAKRKTRDSDARDLVGEALADVLRFVRECECESYGDAALLTRIAEGASRVCEFQAAALRAASGPGQTLPSIRFDGRFPAAPASLPEKRKRKTG